MEFLIEQSDRPYSLGKIVSYLLNSAILLGNIEDSAGEQLKGRSSVLVKTCKLFLLLDLI
jgi:hypothetical protein